MRVRAIDLETGEMLFGGGINDFLVNSPAAVGQYVLTALKLMQGEWFLDQTVGVAYSTKILVEGGRLTADQEIRRVILGCPGVTGIASYSSSIQMRALTVQVTIDTAYGQTEIAATL